jgi:hypothetical protein
MNAIQHTITLATRRSSDAPCRTAESPSADSAIGNRYSGYTSPHITPFITARMSVRRLPPKQELVRMLEQYEGGLMKAILKLYDEAHEAGRRGLIADEIAKGLFPNLRDEELWVVGDIVNREIIPELRHPRAPLELGQRTCSTETPAGG